MPFVVASLERICFEDSGVYIGDLIVRSINSGAQPSVNAEYRGFQESLPTVLGVGDRLILQPYKINVQLEFIARRGKSNQPVAFFYLAARRDIKWTKQSYTPSLDALSSVNGHLRA